MKLRLVLLLTLVGCVKKADGTLGQSDSQSIGQALSAEVEDGAQGFGSVSTGATVDATCVTLSGDTADPDGDSIPNNAMLAFDCTSMVLGITTKVTGTETVTDGQPSSVAWAFSANANLHGSITTAGRASIVTDRSGAIVASQASIAGPFALERMLTVTTVLTGEAGNSVTVDEDNAWTLTYTPQLTWTPGVIAVTGSLAATGSWTVTIGANSADATLSTPTPLTLTPSCATRVTAGSVVGTWTGGGETNTVTVTWTGCGASSVVYTSAKS